MDGDSMKHTNETIRRVYLTDLTLPDTFHGRSTPKVKYINQWECIPAYVKNEAVTIPTDGGNTWVLSDSHFFHKKIIEYTNRPFESVEEMNAVMVSNYKAVVKPDDIVIWCGDITFSQDSVINEILRSLPGYKIHILGNHDFDRSGKVKKLDVDERYICYVMNAKHKQREFQIIFSHYPITKIPKNCVNVHGHLHLNVADPWNINVCVEHTSFTPIGLSDIVVRAYDYLESK